MQDLANMFLQAFQKHHFSEKLEGLRIEVTIKDLTCFYFVIDSGQIALSQDFSSSDILLEGTISQWTAFILSQGKERRIHIQGHASKLTMFQQECDSLIERYKDDVPSFLEIFASHSSEQLRGSFSEHYASRKDVEAFSKDILDLCHRLEKLQRTLEQGRLL